MSNSRTDMSPWLEIELKLGLPGENAWNWVRNSLGPGHVVEQVNHFFDGPDRMLQKRRIGVRLRSEISREASTTRLLSVKSDPSQHDAGPLSKRLEMESVLDSRDFDRAIQRGLSLDQWLPDWRRITPTEIPEHQALGELLDVLESANEAGPLECYARFANRREHLPFRCTDSEGPLEIEIELDRTEFPGGRVDFEIEVERTSERDESMQRTHRALVQWLETNGGIRPFSVKSKLARLNSLLGDSLLTEE